MEICPFINAIKDFFVNTFVNVWTQGVNAWTDSDNWKSTTNAFKIDIGLFNGDIGQILSRLTWEAPQTYIGYTYSQVKNYIGEVDRVDYYGGAIFCTNEDADVKDGRGVTIGNYINIDINDKIDSDFNTYLRTAHDGLYMHEYGHTFQSTNYGFLYLPYIGSQSLISAAMHDDHKNKWYEREASAYGRRHFGEEWWGHNVKRENPTYGFFGFND